MNWKPYEPFLHGCMGFVAQFVNGRWWWLERRERKQLPPATAKHPVVYLERSDDAEGPTGWIEWKGPLIRDGVVKMPCTYWPKVRCMDTLNDSRQYDIGGTIAWFFVVGGAFALGWWLA